MKNLLVLLLSGFCLLLAACSASVTKPNPPPLVKGKVETPQVRLQVKGGQLEVKNSPNPNCKGASGVTKGCLVTGQEDISFAKFELQGSGQYDLTRLWLCDSKEKPTRLEPKHPIAFDCELLGDRASEFLVIVGGTVLKPNADGEVVLGDDVREFFLLNQNRFEGEYFYLIEACPNNGDCTVLDPRIRNGGRKIIR